MGIVERMISQQDNALWFKMNALFRYVLIHTAAKILQLYVINEYPKSGASWIGEMVSDALDIPFPRNRLPMLRPSVMHGHMMHCWNMHNALIVWRDGRDVLVSQYYHSLFENDRGNARLVRMCRADLGFGDYENIRKNLPAFMEYVYERCKHPRMSWTDFAAKWSDCRHCVHVKYEDMRANPVDELTRVIAELSGKETDRKNLDKIVARHSFEKLSGRRSGEQSTKSFLRKGIVGDWKNHFNLPARQKFDGYAGEWLVNLGYEADHNWVKG